MPKSTRCGTCKKPIKGHKRRTDKLMVLKDDKVLKAHALLRAGARWNSPEELDQMLQINEERFSK